MRIASPSPSRRTRRHDLHLSDAALGALGGFAFALLYGLAALPIARIADRGHAARVIALSVAAWSLATAATGRAHGYSALFAARVGVGIGEAGVAPASLALLTSLFAPARRATVLAMLYGGGYCGLVLGLAGGGALVDRVGWRAMFGVLAIPGLVLAVLIAWLVPVPNQIPGGELHAPRRTQLGADLRILLASPVQRDLLAYAATAGLVAWGGLQWDPVFYMRSFHLTAGQAGLWFGVVFGAGTVIGTLAGGPIADALARVSDPARGLRFALFAYLAGQPFQIAAYATRNEALSLTAMAITVVTGAVTVGPVFAALQSNAPPNLRALAASLYGLSATLIGAGLGPPLFGFASDWLTPAFGVDSLRVALIGGAVLGSWPAFHLWRIGSRLRQGRRA